MKKKGLILLIFMKIKYLIRRFILLNHSDMQKNTPVAQNKGIIPQNNSSEDSVYRFENYDLPISLINLTGAGPDSFGTIANSHIAHLQSTVGIDDNHFVLEIGCGIGRDAIQLAKIIKNGQYVGVDIIKQSIDWCTANITKKHDNFKFIHYDIKDQLHNPLGISKTVDINLPLDDHSVNRIILWSVFTHMFQEDIIHYIKEFTRLLSRDGLVFASFFIVNDDIIASAQKTNLTPYDLRFEHLHQPGCYINDPVHPLGAVAYTEEALRFMINTSGLKLVSLRRGNWSGHFPEIGHAGQDEVILSR